MSGKEYIRLPHVMGEIKSRFTYNAETGQLFWAYRPEVGNQNRHFNKHFAGKLAGKVTQQACGYKINKLCLDVFGKRITLVTARVCWLVKTGDWPKQTVDHINGDSLDNSWENLRDVTQGVNNSNKKPYKCKKEGYKGVTPHNDKYWARISCNKITHRLGHFDTPEEAARAYDRKAIEIWGNKAVLNFIQK